MITSKRKSLGIFLCLAIVINLTAAILVRQLATVRPAVAAGALIDMVLVVPTLYYFLLVRPGFQGWITIPGVFLLSFARAAFVVPALSPWRAAAVTTCEAGVMGMVLWRIAAAVRRPAAGLDGDILPKLESAVSELFPSRTVARLLACELAVFYYALFSWRAKPDVPAGAQPFTLHRESGIALLFAFLAAASLAEVAGVHVLISRWSVAGAWLATALGAYGMLWLTALARAIPLRPILLSRDGIHLRFGLLRSARVPLPAIRAVYAANRQAPLGFTGGNQPQFVIELHEPVPVERIYARPKLASSFSLAVDQPGEFRQALRAFGIQTA